MLERVPMLTPTQCELVLERLQAHRSRWTQRYPGLPFYTLGAASYLDAEAGNATYYEQASALNPLLKREFGWLYERLLFALGRHLKDRVRFESRAALPGFHIFLAHRAFRKPLGKIHFDLQFANIDWPAPEQMDHLHPVSYTLAIRLPVSGGGLCTWTITKAEYDEMEPDERARIGRERSSTYIPYAEGEMICHSGMILHRIAPAGEEMRTEDMRVTLQGHALLGRDGYRLYW